tara:strand:+ start:846 stop:1553 length:708 start_codon:yes stop_codon:yes gene_type:complete
MAKYVDPSFDFYTDTPTGRDPDSFSPTLRRYHKYIWSKPLPTGAALKLSDEVPGAYLCHQSNGAELVLSSDALGHTYRYVKAMAPVIEQVPERDLDRFFKLCSTIGAYTLFPARKIDGKMTINGARGFSSKLRDRFDLTLECIRRHYASQPSPLSDVLARYSDFFALFGSFSGYVDFFLFQDLTDGTENAVKFWLPFDDFNSSPLPKSVCDYDTYKSNVTTFIHARNRRISATDQ